MRMALLAWIASVSLFVVGCSGSGGGHMTGQVEAGNQAPRISGSPSTVALMDEYYDFRPSVADADGDVLTFAIAHKPGWARFSKATGRLSGKPGAHDVGTYSNIRIMVSDGSASASLPGFSIAVTQAADGSVTLSWMPPVENSDGTPLSDLAGYRIYLGRAPGNLSRRIVLDNPGLTRYVVEGLPPATWYFAMTSVNARGRESRPSAVLRKTVG